MDPGAILVGLAITVLTGAFVLRPIFEPSLVGEGQVNPRLSQLQAQRDRVLDALREMDMDHAMGKLPEPDYRAERAALAAYGASVLRQIDDLGGLSALQDEVGSGLEAELEAAVARLRQPVSTAESQDKFCTRCGEAVMIGDRFCANCGEPIGIPGDGE